MDNVIFASCGNDSVALIQWCYEKQLRNVVVAYSNTGWAASYWLDRVVSIESWVRTLGFDMVQLASEGMLNLVTRKKAWPRGGGGKYQFCTAELKIKPAMAWLDKVDPEKQVVCLIGIRREESPNRALFPEWIEESENHGGRSLHAPLVRYTELERNLLIMKTPFEVLPHKSKECYPCVNAKKKEIAALEETKLNIIREKEKQMGTNSKGNKRVMFSPKRHKGAVGIDAVYNWSRGVDSDDIVLPVCDGGWCGS